MSAVLTNPAPRTPPRTRVALWDNARFLLIAGVVISHLITTIRTESTGGLALYTLLFLVHMPGMFFLSGVFSKPDLSSKTGRGVAQLIVIWVTWELIWIGLRALLGQGVFSPGFLVVPAWSLWFLASLATMRMLLPFIARFRYPVTLSFVIALASALSPYIGAEFSASRTLAFLPFFVVGWAAQDRGWFRRDRFLAPGLAQRLGAWILIIGSVVLLLLTSGLGGSLGAAFGGEPGGRFWRIDRWVIWKSDVLTVLSEAPIGYEGAWIHLTADMGAASVVGGLFAVALLVMWSFALVWAVLVVTPRGENRLTVWGQRTLYVYLLHGPIVQVLRESGAIDWLGAWHPHAYLWVVPIGIVLTVALSTTFVARITRPIIEPSTDWLRREQRA